MRLWPGLLLACSLGCSPRGEDTKIARSEPEPEHATPCKDDDDCRLSCLEPGNCCGEPPFCAQARHWDDHRAIEATRTDCLDFDYSTCPAPDYTVPAEVALPVCKRKRCQVKMIPREPPPAPIDLAGYDRSCSTDADCVVVHTQPCAKCGCGDDPISAKELTRFREAIAAVQCPPYDPWPNIDCGDCRDAIAFCDAGQCSAR